MPNTFTEMDIDVLKEVINIGGGSAATSIAKMFDRKVNMNVPVMEQMTYEQVFAAIMPAETVVKAVQIQIEGDMEGQFLLLMDEEGIISLDKTYANVLRENTDLADSAICELANILVNQFLQAIIKLLDIEVTSSVPYIGEDMFGSLLTSAYLEEFQYDDSIWIFKNEFWIDDQKWDSALYFVPKDGVLKKLVTNMK